MPHACEFIFVACGVQQPRVYTNVATRQRERVDIRIVDNEKSEILAAVVGLRGNPAADFVDVLGYQWILYHSAGGAYLCHDRTANLRLIRFRQYGIGRTSHVR